MTEFTSGLHNTVKEFAKGSFGLAFIFFIGHVIIAMVVVKIMTGASFLEAGAVALVEPMINSVWFYVLHKLYKRFRSDK